MDFHLLSQYLLSGLVIGVIYSLMALGITFIYSIMKMINWSMGEFYMIGSYVQYFLLASVLGWDRWYVALPLAMASVFLLGVVVQRFLLRPMYVGGVERRDEYATVMTIALMVLFRNLAIVLGDLGCMLNIEGRLRRRGDKSTRVLHVAEVLAGWRHREVREDAAR